MQGVEISSVDRATGTSLHVLGYFRGVDRAGLNAELAPVVQGYNQRARRIIASLNERHGCGFDFEQILREITPAVFVSRNALAAQLQRCLGSPIAMKDAIRLAFVPGENDVWMPDSTQAITLVHKYGGVAVLAHPGAKKLPETADIAEIIGRLASAGLCGVEVYHPGHAETTVATLSALARRYDLAVTAGSDWHGEGFSRHSIGMESPLSSAVVLKQLFHQSSSI